MNDHTPAEASVHPRGSSQPAPRSERQHLAGIHYLPRTIIYAYNGIVWPVVLNHGGADLVFWGLWLGLHFLWPHLAWVLTRFSTNPLRTQRMMLLGEAAVVGFTINELGFIVWHGFAVTIALVAATIGLGAGARLLSMVLGSLIAGALGWGLWRGFSYYAMAPLDMQLAGAAGGALPIIVITYASARVTEHLRRARRHMESRSDILEALVEMGINLRAGGQVDEIVSRALKFLADLLPTRGLGIVLLDCRRPTLVHHTAFHRIATGQARDLLHALLAIPPDERTGMPCHVTVRGEQWLALPMSAHLSQLEGYLLVQGEMPGSMDANAAFLFLEQLASVLESTLLNTRLERLARTDPLTGLHNRSCFEEQLQQALTKHNSAAATPFSVVQLDLNDLKLINDQYGHEAGDQAILTTAQVLDRTSRETDVLVRMGGDEFVILAHDCDSIQARRLLERLEKALDGLHVTLSEPDTRPQTTIPLSLSMGAASTDETPADQLLQQADRRMYEHKKRYHAQRADGDRAPGKG